MVQLAEGQIGDALGNDGNGGADAQANQALEPVATPSSSSSSAAAAWHYARKGGKDDGVGCGNSASTCTVASL